MADPLSLTAEQMAPSPAGRSFFDTSVAGDIINRYAISRREEADARARLQDAAAIQRLAQQRELYDRDTLAYQEQQDFKANRGTLLESLAGLDPEDDEYENKVSNFLSTSPELVAKDDAVQAMLKVKQDRFALKQQERKQAEYDRRRQDEANRLTSKQVSLAMAEEGLDPTPFTNPETGEFDMFGAVRSMARARQDREVLKQNREIEKEEDKADANYFDKDPYVLDIVRNGNLEAANSLFEQRFNNSVVGKLPDTLRNNVLTDTLDAFVARVQQPVIEKIGKDPNKVDAELTPAEKSMLGAYADVARSVYSAARGLSTLSRRAKTTRSEAAPQPAQSYNPYLDGLFKRAGVNKQ